MPPYMTPGVYVESVPSRSKPIEGVSTSVAAFVGLTPAGPINEPVRIANWSQFVREFSDANDKEQGPFIDGAYLAHAVYGFFENGGSLCWVLRVGPDDGRVAPPPEVALPGAGDGGGDAFRVRALNGAGNGIAVEVVDTTPAPPEAEDGADAAAAEPSYKLVVTAGDAREEHDGLTGTRRRSFVQTVNRHSKLIEILEETSKPADARRFPAPGRYELAAPPTTGTEIQSADFAGDVARRKGIGALAALQEVSIIAAPDIMALARNGDDAKVRDLQTKLISHCEQLGDRMAILDAPPGLLPGEVLEWRMTKAGYDSPNAAFYYPWVEVSDPLTKRMIKVPPCGHVAGVWCRSDQSRGVHKAPANEVARGVTGLAFQITDAEQGSLNQAGINCIRAFPGRGIRLWGARTMSSDPEWRYVNVRRTFVYIAESIKRGTQWSVFEPNDQKLWIQLRIAASSFLTRTWRDGALFGSAADQAFYVLCNEETNPPDVIEAGQVVCEIGIAPVKPAEFVIFRLSQFTDRNAEIEA